MAGRLLAAPEPMWLIVKIVPDSIVTPACTGIVPKNPYVPPAVSVIITFHSATAFYIVAVFGLQALLKIL